MKLLAVRNSSRPALLDDEDFARLFGFPWRISKVKRNATQYVVRDERRGDKTVKFLLHREVIQAAKGVQVDHRNRDGLDNQKHNLRVATLSQNQHNRVGNPESSSKYKGVSWNAEGLSGRSRLCLAGLDAGWADSIWKRRRPGHTMQRLKSCIKILLFEFSIRARYWFRQGQGDSRCVSS